MKTLSTFTDAGWDFLGESANGSEDIWTVDPTKNDGYPYIVGLTPDAATPITLSSFTAEQVKGQIELSWETESETNNAVFLIYRNDELIAKIDGAGTSSATNNYVFADENVIPDMSCTYVLADVDYANNETKYINDAVKLTIASQEIDETFELVTAYPNPFNPITTINIKLSDASHVVAYIFDAQGKYIQELFSGEMAEGSQDLVWDASTLNSGVYFLSVQTERKAETQKLVLLK